MNVKTALLAASCALALSACGERTADTTVDTTPTPAPAATMPVPTPVESVPATPSTVIAPVPADAPLPGGDKPAAVVANCATEIEGNDAMQFNVGAIVVPASCSDFKITLRHTGKLAANVMGHNVVIVKDADLAGVAADGISAGIDAGHVKAGDARVVAHSTLVGGGQTTSVSFPVNRIKDGGPYAFFCSFPGHAALMKGTISVQ